MNQDKLEMVKMARVNINILEISKLKWTGMGVFMTLLSTTLGKNPLEETQ